MKTLNQILAGDPTPKQLSRLVDQRMDHIADTLDRLRNVADEAAEMLLRLDFSTYEVRNELMPLLIKAASLARKL